MCEDWRENQKERKNERERENSTTCSHIHIKYSVKESSIQTLAVPITYDEQVDNREWRMESLMCVTSFYSTRV